MIQYTDYEKQVAIDIAEHKNVMFTTKGWQYLVEELEEHISIVDTLDGVDDELTLFYRRGVLDALRMVVNQPTMVDQLLHQEDDDVTSL